MTETNITMDDLTTENLDRVAKKLQEDSRPSPDNQKLWDDRLVSLLKQLVDHFEDGNDVIIQAKLGDQLPRMFEKMRDNVRNQAEQVRKERAVAMRQHVGIEITQLEIDKLDEKLDRLRQQWWILNHTFKLALDQVRPHAQSVVSFGKYQTLAELPRVKRLQLKKNALTIDTYKANSEDFWSFARDTGLIEYPSDNDFGSADFSD